MRRLLTSAICASLTGAALLLTPNAVHASSSEYSCSGATFVMNVEHMSAGAACQVVRTLEAWLEIDHHSDEFYRCTGERPGPRSY